VRPGCWCGWCRRSRGHEADPSFDDAIAAATVGSGGNHPDLAARRLQVPGRIRLMLGPLSTPAPTPMSRTFSPVIRGVTQTRRCPTHPVHSGKLDRCDELLRPSRRVMKPGGISRGFARRAADGVGVAEPYATRTALGKSPPQRSKRRDRQLRQAQLRAPGLQQALSPAGML
jgi:hypothetical protein